MRLVRSRTHVLPITRVATGVDTNLNEVALLRFCDRYGRNAMHVFGIDPVQIFNPANREFWVVVRNKVIPFVGVVRRDLSIAVATENLRDLLSNPGMRYGISVSQDTSWII